MSATARLVRLRAAVVLVAAFSALLSVAGPAGAAGDDYPYRTQTNTSALDPWSFTERQCVSFAAFRLAQSGHTIKNTTATPWGNASHWDDEAYALGKTRSRTAKVGSIAQWNASQASPYYSAGSAVANGTFTAGPYGHVGWVKAVYSDGSALVEQYNMSGSRSYSTMRVKAPLYLYL